MLNPSMIIHQLGLLCVLDLDDRASLGEDGVRDSTWTDVCAQLGRLPATMVDVPVVVRHGQSRPLADIPTHHVSAPGK